MDYLSLKNGSDVRGVALACCGLPVTLTGETVRDIAAAFTLWIVQKTGKKRPVIAVGHDSRLSAEELTARATEGITSRGGSVLLTGLSSTPSMYALLKADPAADASVMITASHLPKDRNGLKFFTRDGGLESGEVEEVLRLAETLPPAEDAGTPDVRSRPFLAEYAAQLVGMVRKATGEERPLTGKRIIVDAGGGAGGFYADLVLRPLGADVTGSQFLSPDGNFPDHIPNPENREAMRSVCDAVRRSHADFGIIFDTDVDRAGAVAKGGAEINRNRLIALISAVLLRERPGTIVTDSVTSDGLSDFIKAHGGVHYRYKRGYKNVIDEAKRLNAEGIYAPLAIETSGHAALMENDFLDDGAYLVTRLLIALADEAKRGRELTDLIADLPEPAEAVEVRPSFLPGCDFHACGERLLAELEHAVPALPGLALAPDNREGVRIVFDETHGSGWALVRMSLHEPILPINAESSLCGGTRLILRRLYAFLAQYPFLDLTELQKIIKE